ncbi:cyclin-domain-containing protein [Pavlovales sp. CCMP2436]|nr:cyclin-domain-containing protein [Pavlovales sp. CCMP2436]|mmetsp:Transcript_25821/g.65515  ORF Transcript_25821/g.65515 Transcript_25821/m.65515 type:complete len:235 (+) Transcript_25821:234-938(+)
MGVPLGNATDSAAPPGCPQRIVQVIAQLLTDLVHRNDQLPVSPADITPFHSSKPPAISVSNYLVDRILKYAGVSEETMILALIYMDLVVQYNPQFVITSLNIHRLLITSVMLASKFFDDLYYNNAYYARVGGISNLEVNNLEMEMLRLISFSLYVSPELYERYRTSLYDQIRWAPAAPPLPAAVAPPAPALVQMQMQQKQAPMDASDVIMDHSAPIHYHSHSFHGMQQQVAFVS